MIRLRFQVRHAVTLCGCGDNKIQEQPNALFQIDSEITAGGIDIFYGLLLRASSRDYPDAIHSDNFSAILFFRADPPYHSLTYVAPIVVR